MNKYSKKNLIITLKVILAHIFVILILDINSLSKIKKNENNFNKINNAQFLNLKSISQKDIEDSRKLIKSGKLSYLVIKGLTIFVIR